MPHRQLLPQPQMQCTAPETHSHSATRTSHLLKQLPDSVHHPHPTPTTRQTHPLERHTRCTCTRILQLSLEKQARSRSLASPAHTLHCTLLLTRILQLVVRQHHLAVHLGGRHRVADLGVDVVCKVHHRGALRVQRGGAARAAGSGRAGAQPAPTAHACNPGGRCAVEHGR